MIEVLIGIGGLAAGFIAAKVLEKGNASKTVLAAKKEAESVLREAKIEGENIKRIRYFKLKKSF